MSQKNNSELPSKELGLFKQILRQYEHKQYKKGLKNAEQILKKFPNHGETLAMKGLFLSHLDNKPEAYECVKNGLRCHLTSPICWHVYGLLYRSDKNYEEAMKCYRHALKYDKDNVQVLRDFSYLQIQMRDYERYNETVSRLLHLRSNQRAFWIALAISFYLLKNYDAAVKVIDAFRESEKDKKDGKVDFETSELLLFKNMIICESKAYSEAYKNICEIKPLVCDVAAWKERKAEILLELENFDEATQVYSSLMERNPENEAYIRGYLKALGLKEPKEIISCLESLQLRFPRSHLVKKMTLFFATDDEFEKHANIYLKSMLRKGVPSLFANLKAICKDEAKARTILQLSNQYLNSFKSIGKFSKVDEEADVPSSFVWLLYFLAQFHDRIMLKYDLALEFINEAIEHTPTLLELYMLKARVLKHIGKINEAAECMNFARELDLQDRFVNSKSTKYYIRADCIDKAEKVIALFAKQGTMDEKMLDLVDMQCMWFSIECGYSFMRQNDYGQALNRFHQICKHFQDITDDQFDFHTYCLRKMTIRSYLNLLTFEDELYNHKFYLKAMEGAAECYIRLFDDSALLQSQVERCIARKKNEALKLLTVDSLLDEALKLLKPSMRLGKMSPKINYLAFEIFLRKKNVLLALKSVHVANILFKTDSKTAEMQIKLKEFIKNIDLSKKSPLIRDVVGDIDEAMKRLCIN